MTARRDRTVRRRRIGAVTTLGALLLIAFIGLALYGRFGGGATNALVAPGAEAPSVDHPFGTDTLGRDLFDRVAAGAWTSLTTSAGAVGLAVLLAVPVGVLAAHAAGRWPDQLLMRVVETAQVVPPFILVIVILGMLGPGTSSVVGIELDATAKLIGCLALGFVPFFARVTRSATLVELQEDYVDSLHLLGVPRREVLFREVLPNVASAITVQIFLALAIAVFAEGGLSVIGLGVAPPEPTLGNLITDAGAQLLDGAWWYALIPGATLVAGITGCNLVADAIAERLLDTRGGAATPSDAIPPAATGTAGPLPDHRTTPDLTRSS